MLKKYCIKQEEIEKIAGKYEAKSLWDDAKYATWNISLQKKLEDYIESVPGNEKLKADDIYNLFYPEKNIPIFISHSSKNKDLAQKLALWLKDNLGLYSFIDSDLWGNISVIQQTLDDKYCDPDPNYNYKKRNQCTAHVHMILAYALTRMIDKADFFIFVKTNDSVSLEDSIERTNSSWIFHELVTASLIKSNSSFEIFPIRTTGMFCESETDKPIPISYPIPLDGFDTLNHGRLKSIADAYSDLKMDGKGSFARYQIKQYWLAKNVGKEIPSDDIVAKNCLFGYKKEKL